MKAINRVVSPGRTEEGNIFIRIEYKDKKLSISGVVGPRSNGDCSGSCGQIQDELVMIKEIDSEWDQIDINKLYDVWERWHLNDMNAGCKHQKEWVNERINPKDLPNSHVNRDQRGILSIWVTPEEHKDGLLTKKCPECGYGYGTNWLFEEVPNDVIDFLDRLPETTKSYAWV
jgi:hypothetical protein